MGPPLCLQDPSARSQGHDPFLGAVVYKLPSKVVAFSAQTSTKEVVRVKSQFVPVHQTVLGCWFFPPGKLFLATVDFWQLRRFGEAEYLLIKLAAVASS